jgi:hypothetical protein
VAGAARTSAAARLRAGVSDAVCRMPGLVNAPTPTTPTISSSPHMQDARINVRRLEGGRPLAAVIGTGAVAADAGVRA